MAYADGSPSNDQGTGSPGFRSKAVRLVQGVMEGVLLVMVTLSPWVYGAVHPGFEFLLDAGVGLLLVLWGVRMVLEGQFTWQKCPVALCLAGLFLLGIGQAMPWPRPLLDRLSPATAQMYGQLLPAQPEVLPIGTHGPGETPSAGRTISFYPGATKREALRLLAVFLVFAVVRNNLVSEVRLRRLCVVSLVNGAVLALFALIQFFTSPRNTLYWTYPSLGQVFGPFINRNHFPFYVNVCIGLGTGLLLSRNLTSEIGPANRPAASKEWVPLPQERMSFGSLLRLLHDPVSLWIAAALALMISSVAFSLSRGGFLALVGGLGVCLLFKVLSSRHSVRLGIGVLIGGMAVALASWFGFDLIKARLGTLWQAETFEEGRLAMWSRTLPVVADFPIWGTGYGTFEHVEPLHRTTAVDSGLAWGHAHNDYVEILVEGGVVGLSLSLSAIGLVFWLGFQALRSHEGQAKCGLVLGALFGFTTLVIHSFGDFGMHVPAIALLATVVCAQVGGLGSADGSPYRFRLGGLAPLFGAAACFALGWMLCAAGWKAHRVERLKLTAARLSESAEIDSQERRIASLEQAVSLAPLDAYLLLELGHTRIYLYQIQQDHLQRTSNRLSAVETVLLWPVRSVPASMIHPALTAVSSWMVTRAARQELIAVGQDQLTRDQLLPALRSYLRARDACPLMREPQMGIAAYREKLRQADPRHAYLERAKFLAPCNPAVWYRCGRQELRAKEPLQAWASWRRCLELSDKYLPDILGEAGNVLGARTMVQRLLPDRPEILLAAAARLYPEAEATEERRPFLEKALSLFETQSGPLNGPELHVKALVHKSLGQGAEARQTFQTLLKHHPEEVGWRHEFAQLLYDQGRLEETRQQLLIILAQQPTHGAARELLTIVTREIARQN